VKGKLNALRREAKDRLLGYHRASAYDLSVAALRRAGDDLLRQRPAYVIAYSSALHHFAQANVNRSEAFAAISLKAAIATAEAFPRPDSAQQINRVLGCPVAMEYGAVETGPIAHQKRDGRFTVFWQHWFVEGVPSAQATGAHEIFLTSLYPRCVPLVRYRIGDLISANPSAEEFDQTFERVIGRCNDCVLLPGGGPVHSEAFSHAVKDCPFVSSFQVTQRGNGDIEISYVLTPGARPNEDEVRRRLALIQPALANIEMRQVTSLEQTVAGKSRTIRRDFPD
jgi:phenylacetate-coenzyme A ligase PaaK-like adenylate-forming protein